MKGVSANSDVSTLMANGDHEEMCKQLQGKFIDKQLATNFTV